MGQKNDKNQCRKAKFGLFKGSDNSPHSNHPRTSGQRRTNPQSGNVFFTLFGAVAVVGVLGAGIMSTMRGPLSTMVDVNRIEQAKSEMRVALGILLTDADPAQDGDSLFEPLDPDDTCAIATANSGCIPNTNGAPKSDPWGNLYRYCGWNNGSEFNAVGDRILAGGTLATNVAVALISAGPDGNFNNDCAPDPTYVPSQSAAVGDDIIISMTYTEAVAGSGGLWTPADDGSGNNFATIDRNIDLTGAYSSGFSAQLKLGAASMLLPTNSTAGTGDTDCSGANDLILRINESTTPPRIELCDGTNSTWEAAGGSVWVNNGGGEIYFNTGTPQVGIGTASPGATLDVVGNVDISTTLSVGTTSTFGETATFNGTGNGIVVAENADINGDIDVAGTSTLVGAIDAQGAISNSASAGADPVTIDDDLQVNQTSTFSDTATFNGTGNSIVVAKDADIDGYVDISGANVSGFGLVLAEDADIDGFVDIAEYLTIAGADGNGDGLIVTQDAEIGGALDVTGTVTGGDLFTTGRTTTNELYVDVASDGTGSVNFIPLSCGPGKANRWDGDSWECETISDAIGEGGTPLLLNDLGDVDTSGVGNEYCLIYDSSGTGTWKAEPCADAGLWEDIDNTIRLTDSVKHANRDFVFGSDTLAQYVTDDTQDARMFFDKSKAAFRAGSVDTTEWNDANVGVSSMALGLNLVASGVNSFAAGYNTTASGDASIAMGYQAVAGNGTAGSGAGDYSMALGLGDPSGARPGVTGVSSFGIFMGDQSGYNLNTSNTMALIGGQLMIDDVGSSANAACLKYDSATSKLLYSDDCTTFYSFTDDISGLWTEITETRIHFGDDDTVQVGIGTNTPQTTLDVNGGVRVGTTSGGASPAFMDLDDLGDVAVGAPADNFCLVFDQGSDTWGAEDCDQGGGVDPTKIVNANGDTQVQVEEGADDDTIRFDTSGEERMTIDPDGNVVMSSTGALTVPVGDDDARDALVAANGMIRYNTDDAKFEMHQAGAWTNLGNASVLNDLSDAQTDYTASVATMFLGEGAGAAATPLSETIHTIGIGYNALNSITTGDRNIAIGSSTLSALTGADNNIAMGYQAMLGITAGSNNIAIGHNVLSGTVGTNSDSVGIGNDALKKATSSLNTAIGHKAGEEILTGQGNTMIGALAGQKTTTQSGNTYVGYMAGNAAETSGSNTALGTVALQYFTNNNGNSGNTAIGNGALAGVDGQSTGEKNTALGHDAGRGITTGDYNIILGADQDAADPTGNYQLNIGGLLTGTLNAGLLTINGTGALTVPVGDSTARDALTAANGMIRYNTTTSMFEMYQAGAWTNLAGASNINDLSDGLTDYANTNMYLGQGAGGSNGVIAGYDNNIGIGVDALSVMGTGCAATDSWRCSYNIALGNDALKDATTATSNIAIGRRTLENITDNVGNTGIGEDVLRLLTTGSSNTVIGPRAFDSLTNGSNNLGIGENAGTAMTTGSNNVFLGDDAGQTQTQGSNNIAIGQNIQLANTTGDNQLNIGNTIYGNLATDFVGIGTAAATPGAHLHVGTATGDYARFRLSAADYTLPNYAGSQSLSNVSASPTFGQFVAHRAANLSVNDRGGMIVEGFTTNGTNNWNALVLLGQQGGNSPTEPAVVITGQKWNGVNNRTALQNNEPILDITNYYGGGTVMRVQANGRVGIGTGTSAINSTVHINDPGNAPELRISGPGNAIGQIVFEENGQGNNLVMQYDAVNNKFHISEGTTNTEMMTFDRAAHLVGIMNDSPTVTLDVGGTDAIIIPSGTNAQRPAGAAGMLRYNTDATPSDVIEYYDAQTAAWIQLSGGSGGLWTDNGTHISRGVFRVLDAGETLVTAGLDSTAYSGLVYYSDKYALRSGSTIGGDWNEGNIGNRSTAFGGGSRAGGEDSFAAGHGSSASDARAIAMGSFATASASRAIAMGHGPAATANYAVAIGTDIRATGAHSMAFGGDYDPDTDPEVSAANSVGFFLGDQDGYDLNVAQRFGIVGGELMLDEAVGGSQGCFQYNEGASELEYSDDCTTYAAINAIPSDKRLKTNIAPLAEKGSLLDKIAQVKTYSYNLADKENARTQYGVIAQEIEEIFPELVNTADNDEQTKSVRYIELVAPLIEATKELKAQNEAQNAALENLTKQVELLNTIAESNAEKASMMPLALLLLGLMGGFGIALIYTRKKA